MLKDVEKTIVRVLCVFGTAFLVFATVPFFGASMRHHFLGFLHHSWDAMVRATGTTTLGFLLWTLALAIVTWVATIASKWVELKRQKSSTPLELAITGSLLSIAFEAGAVLALVSMVFGVFSIRTLYNDHQALVCANRTLAAEIAPLRHENEALREKIPPPFVEAKNSLRLRTMRLVEELNIFWSHRPTPLQPVQNPSTDEERRRNAGSDRYWRDAGTAYQNANYRERLLGIVREYKNKGIPTGYMEQGFEQSERLVGAGAFGGSNLDDCFRFMSELCQLRELAYHVDAQDQPIFLTSKPKD